MVNDPRSRQALDQALAAFSNPEQAQTGALANIPTSTAALREAFSDVEYRPAGTFGAELSRGISNIDNRLMSTAGSLGEMAGVATGWDGLEEGGRSMRERWEASRAQVAVAGLQNVENVGDFGEFLASTMPEEALNMGLSIAGGVAGFAVGGPIGAAAGAAGVSFLLNAADNYTALLEDGASEDQAVVAAGLIGIPQAALDSVLPAWMARRIASASAFRAGTRAVGGAQRRLAQETGEAVTEQQARNWLWRASQEGLRGAATEAITEMAQEGMQVAGSNVVTGAEMFTPEHGWQLANAAVIGGALGGVAGGGVGLLPDRDADALRTVDEILTNRPGQTEEGGQPATGGETEPATDGEPDIQDAETATTGEGDPGAEVPPTFQIGQLVEGRSPGGSVRGRITAIESDAQGPLVVTIDDTEALPVNSVSLIEEAETTGEGDPGSAEEDAGSIAEERARLAQSLHAGEDTEIGGQVFRHNESENGFHTVLRLDENGEHLERVGGMFESREEAVEDALESLGWHAEEAPTEAEAEGETTGEGDPGTPEEETTETETELDDGLLLDLENIYRETIADTELQEQVRNNSPDISYTAFKEALHKKAADTLVLGESANTSFLTDEAVREQYSRHLHERAVAELQETQEEDVESKSDQEGSPDGEPTTGEGEPGGQESGPDIGHFFTQLTNAAGDGSVEVGGVTYRLRDAGDRGWLGEIDRGDGDIDYVTRPERADVVREMARQAGITIPEDATEEGSAEEETTAEPAEETSDTPEPEAEAETETDAEPGPPEDEPSDSPAETTGAGDSGAPAVEQNADLENTGFIPGKRERIKKILEGEGELSERVDALLESMTLANVLKWSLDPDATTGLVKFSKEAPQKLITFTEWAGRKAGGSRRKWRRSYKEALREQGTHLEGWAGEYLSAVSELVETFAGVKDIGEAKAAWKAVADTKELAKMGPLGTFGYADSVYRRLSLLLDGTSDSDVFTTNKRFSRDKIRLEDLERGENSKDHRQGKNIGAKQFAETFGLQHVNFGKSLPDGERQLHLNHAFDAFMDLADALGLPVKAIGLGSTLNVTFADRGDKYTKAAAHYEPDNKVINLTRGNGDGSLAHEWGHALEYYVKEIDGGRALSEEMRFLFRINLDSEQFLKTVRVAFGRQRRNYSNMTTRESARYYISNWRNQMRMPKQGLRMNAAERDLWLYETTDMVKEAMILDGIQSGNLPEDFSKAYAATPVEMFARAFESFTFDRVNASEGTSSPYLVGSIVADSAMSREMGYKAARYPRGDERAEFGGFWEYFFDRVTFNDEGEIDAIRPYDGDADSLREEKLDAIGRQLEALDLDELLDTWATGDPGDFVNVSRRGLATHFAPMLKANDKRLWGRRSALYREATRIISENAVGKHSKGKIESGTPQAKEVEEAYEIAVALWARDVATDAEVEDHYQAMVDHYSHQPTMGTRTAESARLQAYSTPAPLAYIAQRLARMTSSKTVYEPTAGNGMLLFGATPSRVLANEIDWPRKMALQYTLKIRDVRQEDAATADPTNGELFDIVIANPPFGKVRDTRTKAPLKFEYGPLNGNMVETTEIDHAIMARSLKSMEDSGRAVFIVGSVKGATEEVRRDGYRNSNSRKTFYRWLYDTYNVEDHFTVDGSLYAKQGAQWPVDVIVINGKGKSELGYPMAKAPRLYSDWASLKETFDGTRNGMVLTEADAGLGGVSEEGGSGGGGGRRTSSAGGSTGGPSGGGGRSGGGGNAGGAGSESGGDSSSTSSPEGQQPDDTGDDTSGVGPDDGGENQDGGAGGNAGPSPSETDQSDDAGGVAGADRPSIASGDANSIFEKDAYERAKARLKERHRTQLNAGLDPEELADYLIIGGFHLERGARTFAHWARAMLEDFGERVRPHLKNIYRSLTNDTRVQEAGLAEAMTDHTTITTDLVAAVATGEANQDNQVSYLPASQLTSFRTQAPGNLSSEYQVALNQLAHKVGEIDAWVADSLGYPREDLVKYFGAEQVDAIALAIDNVNQGAALVLGDQTGIGKGRVAAAMIRYAVRQDDLVPVFFTDKQNLYADMFRDLSDITPPNEGESADIWEPDAKTGKMTKKKGHVTPYKILQTNRARTPVLYDQNEKPTRYIQGHTAGGIADTLTEQAQNGVADYDVVFTTYDQVKGKAAVARPFLEGVAPRAFIILDESHKAGGQANTRQAKDAGLNQAQFVRQLLGSAKSAFFASATWAKRPDIMDLYGRTDMRLAVGNIKSLIRLIQRGGVPLQQILSATLARAGQYIRRETSFEGIEYTTPEVEVDAQSYTSVRESLREIFDWDNEVAQPWFERNVSPEFEGQGDTTGGREGLDANRAVFSSIMHNVVSQMLFAAKAGAAADSAISALKNGERPIITVANTMEKFIEEHAKAVDANVGDGVDVRFNAVLKSYLNRTLRYSVKPAGSTKKSDIEYRYIDLNTMPPAFQERYRKIVEMIDAMDLSKLPLSPIDYMHAKVRAAGYETGEITGRNGRVEYDLKTGTATYQKRGAAVKSAAGRNATLAGFNNGNISMLVLNQSGSTSLSAHASEKFSNRERRLLIVAQAEANIDTHMQMLGRVNRTGQVILPRYEQLVADVPAELRPAGVLLKKMASLNASTTAEREGAMRKEAVRDIFNSVGDEAALIVAMLEPDVHNALGDPLRSAVESKSPEPADGMLTKFTGRLVLLDPAEQRRVWELLYEQYDFALEQYEAAGESPLAMKTLDLDAVTVGKTQVVPPSGSGSPFSGPAFAERVDVKRTIKPHKSDAVREKVKAGLETYDDVIAKGVQANEAFLEAQENGIKEKFAKLKEASPDEVLSLDLQMRGEIGDMAARYAPAEHKIYSVTGTRPGSRKIEGSETEGGYLTESYPRGLGERNRGLVRPGQGVMLVLKNQEHVYGMVTSFAKVGNPKHPLALGSWRVTISLLNGDAAQMQIPLSQLTQDRTDRTKIYIEPKDNFQRRLIIDNFDRLSSVRRDERWMITGNILAGYDWTDGKGTIVNFTDREGYRRKGIFMARDFDLEAHDSGQDMLVTPSQLRDVVQAFRNNRWDLHAKSGDGLVEIDFDNYPPNEVRMVEKGGRKYFTDQEIIRLLSRSPVRKKRPGNQGGAYYGSSLERENETAFLAEIAKISQGNFYIDAASKERAKQVLGLDQSPEQLSTQRLTPLYEMEQADIASEVHEIIKGINPDVTVQTMEAIFSSDAAALAASGAETTDTQEVAGSYHAQSGVIEVSLNTAEFDPLNTAHHEAFHSVEGLLTKQEAEVLHNAAKKAFPDMSPREAVASHFADWATKGSKGNFLPGVRRAFRKIKSFFEKVGNLLRGRGFQSVDDIYAKAKAGDMATREAPEQSPWEQIENQTGWKANPEKALSLARIDLEAVKEKFSGEQPAETVKVIKPGSAKDATFLERYFKTPGAIFRKYAPKIAAVQELGVELMNQMSNHVNRLHHRYSKIMEPLDAKQKERVHALLWSGDSLEMEFTPEELARGWADVEGERHWFSGEEGVHLDAEERKAYRQMRRLMTDLGRYIDMHERKMKGTYKKAKFTLLRQISEARSMSEAEMTALIFGGKRENGTQTDGIFGIHSKIRRADYASASKDGKTLEDLEAEYHALYDEILGSLDPESAQGEKFLDAIQSLLVIESKLQLTSVRKRKGYVPHKFFGNYAVYEVVEEAQEDENGDLVYDDDGKVVMEKVNKLIPGYSSPTFIDRKTGKGPEVQGFWDNEELAIKAANKYAEENSGAELIVKPVGPIFANQSATVLSDTSYFKFVRNLADAQGITVGEAMGESSEVARMRARRKFAGFKQMRKGTEGYSKDIDRVMEAHIGEVVRYVALDELKYKAVIAIERSGLSPLKAPASQTQKVLAESVNAWLRDVMGEKQPFETSLDELFQKPWARPLNVAMGAGAVSFLLTGGLVGSPVVGLLASSYIGARFYHSLSKNPAAPTRALTGDMLGDMAHLKLGAFFNLFSPLVNLSQTVLTTYPVLGSKYTMTGIKRFLEAQVNGRNANEVPVEERTQAHRDYILLQRANIATKFNSSERAPNLFEKEGKLARRSLMFFQGAESFNRGSMYLGTIAQKEDGGMSLGRAMKAAERNMNRTQFDYSNMSKPEILRNTVGRVPLQFKNFMFQMVGFMMNLATEGSKVEKVRFIASVFMMAGALGLPGLDLLDWLLRMMTDDEHSIVMGIQRAALEGQARGDLAGGMANFLARGAPSLIGLDLSTRAGVGERFFPTEYRDWQGPWLSTLNSAIALGRMNADYVDQLRNLSTGAAAPFRLLEASVAGGPVIVHNPWKRGRMELEATRGEAFMRAVGGSPLRHAQMQDVYAIARRDGRVSQRNRNRAIDRIVDAIQSGESSRVSTIMENAREDGIVIRSSQIRYALEQANRPRLQRVVEQASRLERAELARLARPLME